MQQKDYAQAVSENIAALRRKTGMTQDALAEKTGVTFQAVSKWENGLSCPDIALLPELAAIFGTSVDALFGLKTVSEGAGDVPWNDDDALHVVLYRGKTLLQHSDRAGEFEFRYEGAALDIHSEVSVNCGDIEGDVNAGGMVNCGDIEGDVNAGEMVKCGDVEGDVNAGGSVNCGDIAGDVECTGDLSCGDIDGDVNCKGTLRSQ